MALGQLYEYLVRRDSVSIFEYMPEELLGTVESVDTSTVIVKVENDDKLRGLQVNHLISIQSSKVGQHLIGLVSKIIRKSAYSDPVADVSPEFGFNIIKVILIGTHFDRDAGKDNVFRRSLATIPTINAECHLIHGDRLKRFMQAISSIPEGEDAVSLQIGNYSIDEDATAWLNGNKLFQRHAVIVGSTGSGKSWCVAKILEQVASLKSADAILFDIHGEYSTLQGDSFSHLKVAGPNETIGEGTLFLPYWLLAYEEMLSLMLDRSDNNAPNQAMMFSSAVIEGKKQFLIDADKAEMEANITLDSPIPYNLDALLFFLKSKDEEMVPGAKANTEKQGPYFGKLTRFIQRLETKQKDKRLNFMFASEDDLLSYDYMSVLCSKLMLPSVAGKKGVKIIDFSEVPSDILPLIVSLIARIIFSVQQWTTVEHRHPIAIFCDEAHLYIPANTEKSIAPSVSKPEPRPTITIETRSLNGFLVPKTICNGHLYLCAKTGAAPIDISDLVDVRLNHLLRLGSEFAKTYRPQFRIIHSSSGGWSIGEQQNVTNLLNGKKLQAEMILHNEDVLTVIDKDGKEHNLMFVFK